jgi:hypothetical protein
VPLVSWDDRQAVGLMRGSRQNEARAAGCLGSFLQKVDGVFGNIRTCDPARGTAGTYLFKGRMTSGNYGGTVRVTPCSLGERRGGFRWINVCPTSQGFVFFRGWRDQGWWLWKTM